MWGGSGEDRMKHKRTSNCLKIGREDKYFDESEAQGGVVMLPDDGWNQQEFSITRQQ